MKTKNLITLLFITCAALIINGCGGIEPFDNLPTLTSVPSQYSNQAAGDIEFTGADVACSLDGASFADCTSPYAFSGLEDGDHRFEVTIRGFSDSTDSYEWSIDSITPILTIAGPAEYTNVTSATLTISSDKTLSAIACTLGGGAVTCDASSPVSLTGLADGAYVFAANGTDLFGNVGTSQHIWNVDTVAPTPSYVSQNCGPPGFFISLSGGETLQYSFTCDDVPCTYSCLLERQVGLDYVTEVAATDCSTGTYEYAPPDTGKRRLYVTATDRAGNVSAATSSFICNVEP